MLTLTERQMRGLHTWSVNKFQILHGGYVEIDRHVLTLPTIEPYTFEAHELVLSIWLSFGYAFHTYRTCFIIVLDYKILKIFRLGLLGPFFKFKYFDKIC
jgi:hypothetical protein